MNQKLAIETFVAGDLDNNDIILCGIDNIQYANYELSQAQYYNHISNDNNISKVIGLGPSNKFFYNMAAYENNAIRCYEKGIGYAYEHNNKIYFKREIPILYGKNADHVQLVYGSSSKFYFPENSTNVIVSEIPPNIALLYFAANSILVSKEPFNISSLQILNDSVLATVNNKICSLSFSSPEFASYVAESLKSSIIDCDKVFVKQLRLKSSSSSNAKKGSLFYDESSDTIKFYNGNVWRKLKWEEDEKAE